MSAVSDRLTRWLDDRFDSLLTLSRAELVTCHEIQKNTCTSCCKSLRLLYYSFNMHSRMSFAASKLLYIPNLSRSLIIKTYSNLTNGKVRKQRM